MVTDKLAVTADYIYTYYGKAKTTGIGNTTSIVSGGEEGPSTVPFTNIDGLEAQSSGRISTQSAMLGIKYYFMPVC
jgi:opacity protein-like surface antigen